MRKKERKELDKPDQFTQSVGGVLSSFQDKPKSLAIVAGGIIVSILVIMVYSSSVEKKESLAASKFYFADLAFQKEKSALSGNSDEEDEENPLAKPSPADKKKKDAEAAARDAKAAELRKASASETFKESIPKLSEVIEKYPKTKAAYEASLRLGNLYADKGEHEAALPHLQRALEQAPNPFQKSFVEFAMASSQEELGNTEQALTHYHRALQLNNDVLKGDLLLSIARLQAVKKDTENAKKTYQRILSELAKTPYASKAEVFLGRL